MERSLVRKRLRTFGALSLCACSFRQEGLEWLHRALQLWIRIESRCDVWLGQIYKRPELLRSCKEMSGIVLIKAMGEGDTIYTQLSSSTTSSTKACSNTNSLSVQQLQVRFDPVALSWKQIPIHNTILRVDDNIISAPVSSPSVCKRLLRNPLRRA